MKKRTVLALINFIFLTILYKGVVCSAEVVIIKSNDIAPYNLAIKGFKQVVKTGVREYNLKGDAKKTDKIMRQIKQKRPQLVFALGALAALGAKGNLNHKIPIIYSLVLSPKDKDLSGDNIFGISIEADIKKQFEMLKKIMPNANKIGVLYSRQTENYIRHAGRACNILGLKLASVKLASSRDVPDAIVKLLARVDSLWLTPDSIVANQASLNYILLLTLENNIPFMVYNKNFVRAGALFSCGINYTDIGKQAGSLGRQILEGKKTPAVLSSSTKIEWAINLRTAQNMGLKISNGLLDKFKYVYK